MDFIGTLKSSSAELTAHTSQIVFLMIIMREIVRVKAKATAKIEIRRIKIKAKIIKESKIKIKTNGLLVHAQKIIIGVGLAALQKSTVLRLQIQLLLSMQRPVNVSLSLFGIPQPRGVG
jgi:hypothetical protein